MYFLTFLQNLFFYIDNCIIKIIKIKLIDYAKIKTLLNRILFDFVYASFFIHIE